MADGMTVREGGRERRGRREGGKRERRGRREGGREEGGEEGKKGARESEGGRK